jgi:hypothetical protein
MDHIWIRLQIIACNKLHECLSLRECVAHRIIIDKISNLYEETRDLDLLLAQLCIEQ